MSGVPFDIDTFELAEIQRFMKNETWRKLVEVLKDRIKVTNIEMTVAPKDTQHNVQLHDDGSRTVDIINGIEWWQGVAAEVNTLINLPESIEGMLEDQLIRDKEASDDEEE